MRSIASCLLGCLLWAVPVSAADPPIVAIATAPDGETILTGSNLGVDVHVHADLVFRGQFNVEFSTVHDLKFSPDGHSLAVAGGDPGERGVVLIFSWPEKKLLHRLQHHTDVVFDVDWSADGARLVTGGLDKQVLLWKVADESVEREFAGHSKGVTSVCLINKSGLLVSAGIDQSLRVWETDSGELVRTLDNHTAPVNDLALRPAEEALAMVVSCGNDRTLRFWQPTIGRLVRFARFDANPQAAVWLADRPAVAVATADGKILIVDAETTEIIRAIAVNEERLYSLAIDRDRTHLLTGGRNGELERVNLEVR